MKIIGIYPGRFQPAHKGHLGAYRFLEKITGPDTFIVTSDKTEIPNSPLNFREKQQIWVRHGIPANRIVKVKNPYNPTEIISKYPSKNTVVIFLLGEKDMDRLVTKKIYDTELKKEIWVKSDGKTPLYFQPYIGNEGNLKPIKKHGYVIISPDVKINGTDVSGTIIRNILSSPKYTPEQKKDFFEKVFGWYDPSLYQMLVDTFTRANQFKNTPVKKNIIKKQIKKIVSEVIKEVMSFYKELNSKYIDDKNNRREMIKKRQDMVKMKSSAERELKTLYSDLKWKQKSIEKIRNDDIPNLKRKISQINKSLSGRNL